MPASTVTVCASIVQVNHLCHGLQREEMVCAVGYLVESNGACRAPLIWLVFLQNPLLVQRSWPCTSFLCCIRNCRPSFSVSYLAAGRRAAMRALPRSQRAVDERSFVHAQKPSTIELK